MIKQINEKLKSNFEKRHSLLGKKLKHLFDLLLLEFPNKRVSIDYFTQSLTNGFISAQDSNDNVDEYRNLLKFETGSSKLESIIKQLNTILSLNSLESFKSEEVNKLEIAIKKGTETELELKSLSDNRKLILKIISEIKEIKIQHFAEVIGLGFAQDVIQKLESIKVNDKTEKLDLIILKRHEVCSNAAKGYGFSLDADLDALQGLGNQSVMDLYSAEQVQTSFLVWLKEIYQESAYVNMNISPVSRAVSTAFHATYDVNLINEITFDNDFAEQQWSTPLICSGQASVKPSEYAERLKKCRFYAVNSGNDELFKGETTEHFNKRLGSAVEKSLTLSKQVGSNMSINITIGHGDMNKAILTKLFEKFNISSDKVTKLGYGEQYILVAKRNSLENALVSLEYLGIYNRHGCKNSNEQSCKYFQDYLDLSNNEGREQFIKDNSDSLLDNLPQLIFRERAEISKIEFLFKTLYNIQKDRIANRADNKNNPNYNNELSYWNALLLGFKLLLNAATNKRPEMQQASLQSLDAYFNAASGSNTSKSNDDDTSSNSSNDENTINPSVNINEIYQKAKQDLGEGKVTKFIKALLDFEDFKKLISEPNSPKLRLK